MVIVWSVRARSELDNAIDYIKRDSPAGARRVAACIEERVEDLLQFPNQGVAVRGGLRRLDVARTPYLVVSKVHDQTINIVAVLHGRRRRRN